MLKRKIERYLAQWKAEEDRMPLIVKGARQVGKTSSVMAPWPSPEGMKNENENENQNEDGKGKG